MILIIECSFKMFFSLQVKYFPPVEGQYFVRVKLNGRHVPGSPFLVDCSTPIFYSKSAVTNLGFEQMCF